MARISDTERILSLLAGSPQGLSNQRIKNELNLGDDRYAKVRDDLLQSGQVGKYVCRGGGIRLTSKGDLAADAQAAQANEETRSSVGKEKDLYALLIAALVHESPGDVVFDTGSLRKRGKWQNPDVTQISVEVYPRLRKRDLLVTTYEVKPWQAWDVIAAFEAASHARFAHEAWVVLEWPEAGFMLPDSRIDHLVRECRRFGVGLATLQPHESTHRLHEHIAPTPTVSVDRDIEGWLEYALSRDKAAERRFDKMMSRAAAGHSSEEDA